MQLDLQHQELVAVLRTFKSGFKVLVFSLRDQLLMCLKLGEF